jgi:hypothetical protein
MRTKNLWIVALVILACGVAPAGAAGPHGARPGADEELREALAAATSGEDVASAVADSVAVRRALERVRAEPAPAGEVFALIRITDRETGARTVTTRGTPDPRLAEYLARPELAPEGMTYADTEGIVAGDGVEIVTRSIRALSVPAAAEDAVEPTADEDEERALAERNADTGWHWRIEQDLRARLEERTAADEPSSAPLAVAITMKGIPELDLPKSKDPAYGGQVWAGLELAAARERALIERKQLVASLQADLVAAVEELGGRVHYASWMSGLVQAEVPPSAVPALAEHPDTLSIEWIPPAIKHGYMGDDIHIATEADEYHYHTGWNGIYGKHPYSSRVALAMSEECIWQNAPYWRTLGPNSASRVAFWDCDPNSGCTLGGVEECWDWDWVSKASHGHYVAGSMVADFMDGQDVGVTTNSARRRRTSTCEECFMTFVQDFKLNERPKVHDKVCELGADVFEASLGWTSGSVCDGNGFMDASVQSLVNCGVNFVVSAGNKGDHDCDVSSLPTASEGACTTYYPADHPWTFAVGGQDTGGSCNTPGEYYTGTCKYDDCASRGGGSYNGAYGRASINDLTGPFRISHGLVPGTQPAQQANVLGTSFAAPIVAGLMGRVLDWYRVHAGTWIFYGNRMRNLMLLMGDRSAFENGGLQYVASFDKRWGGGRVTLVPFDDLPAWSLHHVDVTLPPWGSYEFTHPIVGSAGLYKAVVSHNGRDYFLEPNIQLTLDPQGCSESTSFREFTDIKGMLAKKTLDGCTSMRVKIRNVPVGWSGTRRIQFAAISVLETNERDF